MGANTSCQNLRIGSNYLCEIEKCTTKVVGLKANSTSPSDIWFLTLQDGTKYGILEIKGEVVMKLFLSLDCNVDNVNLSGAQQLTYESNIYEHVADPILQYQMNPYFVKYYGRALGCTFCSINNILKNHTKIEGTNRLMTEDESISAFARNTAFFGSNMSGRPSINTPVDPNDEFYKILTQQTLNKKSSLKYGMILTEKAVAQTASEWFSEHLSDDGLYDIDAWLVIIQFISALGTLAEFKCMHNDMHLGNLFVKPHDNQTYGFIFTESTVNKKYMFSITSEWAGAVYDWDRSYMNKLGPNPVLSEGNNYLEYFGQSNEYVPQKDLAKFFISCMFHQNKNGIKPNKFTQNFFLDMLFHTSATNYRDHFVNNVLSGNEKYFLVDTSTRKTLHKDFYIHGMRPVNRVLTMMVYKVAVEYGASNQKVINKAGIKIPIISNLFQYDPAQVEEGKKTSTIFDFSTDRVHNMLNLVCGGPCNHNIDCDNGEICVAGKCCKGFITKTQLEHYQVEY